MDVIGAILVAAYNERTLCPIGGSGVDWVRLDYVNG